MKNDLFSIGPFTVHGYGLMIAIGVLSAYYMVEYRAKKKQMDWEKVFPLTVWSVLGGFLGSKILYLLTRLPDILANPALLGSSIKDGFVVYGGIIGGILTAWIYCKCTKWNFWKIFDIAMPAVAMAQGFGRIGCLLAGCCYGIELDPANPIGIVFHNSAYAPNDVALLPTQIISSVLDFTNCFVLLALSKKLKTDGQVASCYLIFYSIGRFVLEYFRGDLIRGVFHVAVYLPVYLSDRSCIAFWTSSSCKKERSLRTVGGIAPDFAEAKPILRAGMETGIFSWTSLPSASSSRTKFLMTQAIPKSIFANSIRRSMEVTSIIREALKFSWER